MALEIQLTSEQEQMLRAKAAAHGMAVEELARQAVIDLIDKGDDPEFARVIERILTRNIELYRRLGDGEFRKHLDASAKENAELLKRLA